MDARSSRALMESAMKESAMWETIGHLSLSGKGSEDSEGSEEPGNT
jgi:hypothetical protein